MRAHPVGCSCHVRPGNILQALCGVAPVKVTGEVTYNGRAPSTFNLQRTARYVDHEDLFNPELTVREVLLFSAMVQGPRFQRGARISLDTSKRIGHKLL